MLINLVYDRGHDLWTANLGHQSDFDVATTSGALEYGYKPEPNTPEAGCIETS